MAITEQSFTDLFRKKIEEEAQLIVNDIAGGGPSDYPEYKEQVGRINGLICAKRILNELEDEYLKQEEPENETIVVGTEAETASTDPVNP